METGDRNQTEGAGTMWAITNVETGEAAADNTGDPILFDTMDEAIEFANKAFDEDEAREWTIEEV